MVARASRGGAEGRWAERWWAAGGAEGWQVEQSDRCARAQRRRRRRPRRSRVRRRSHRVVGVEVGAESAALALDDAAGRDKPDTKRDVFADLGSTVSLLRLRPGAAATSSSSSSSAGSAKSPTLCNAGAGIGAQAVGPLVAEIRGRLPPVDPGTRDRRGEDDVAEGDAGDNVLEELLRDGFPVRRVEPTTTPPVSSKKKPAAAPTTPRHPGPRLGTHHPGSGHRATHQGARAAAQGQGHPAAGLLSPGRGSRRLASFPFAKSHIPAVAHAEPPPLDLG
uniref:Uncharacterized protein n=1 Tax=Oryza sativa subsp. japonica TaxID=39947 RepID=Q67U14_ORYSJ|nr:hypothetical protein [Oryza sativa Japonica Group]BAD38357.1 hypothetical protein [Oryza sativa Japonica Group]